MLKQLVNIQDNTVQQEVDIFIPAFDANNVQTNIMLPDQVQVLPVFGGPWGDDAQFKWIDAPISRLVEIATQDKLQSIKRDMEVTLSKGFTTTSGIVMDANFSSIQMLKAGYDLSILTSQTTMDVTDFNNIDHLAVLLADVNTLLIELGVNYSTIRSLKNTKRTNIDTIIKSKKTDKNKLSGILAV